MTSILPKSALLAASALLLTACLGGGGGTSGGMGQLTLSVTDAPVASAEKVVVSFTGVAVKPESGAAIEFLFEEPREIDLLALTGSLHEVLLDGETVPAGRYEWIRLYGSRGPDTRDHHRGEHRDGRG
ncbi:DUF4382 domain-containing protein [Thioalkalivibrio sulfidiphilus]|uniref:DUF4382 domain-containing protein n=1 Tax=Thioalkalivibrio sulfidiphilus TaxID=1033854 RepID=UPI0003755F77|nr:DUF4382 domain-containing protein [Thioalkalivibrio sulfidiphilus]